MKPFLRDGLQLLNTGEILWLLFLAAVLYAVGRHSVELYPPSRAWPRRMAVLAFLAYGLYAIAQQGLADAETLASAGLRAVVVAFLVASCTAIVLPLIAWLWQQCITKPRQHWLAWNRQRQSQRLQERRERERRETESRARQERERTRPERERAEREAAEQKRLEAERRESDRRRREAARLDCQLLYDRHALALRELLPIERFEALLTQSLNEATSTEIVEQRAAQIRQLIGELVAEAHKGRRRFQDLFEIADHFHVRRQQLDALAYPDRTKAALRAALILQEDAAVQEFLKS